MVPISIYSPESEKQLQLITTLAKKSIRLQLQHLPVLTSSLCLWQWLPPQLPHVSPWPDLPRWYLHSYKGGTIQAASQLKNFPYQKEVSFPSFYSSGSLEGFPFLLIIIKSDSMEDTKTFIDILGQEVSKKISQYQGNFVSSYRINPGLNYQ